MGDDNRVLIGNYFRIFDTEYPTFRNAAKFGSGFIILGGLILYFQSIAIFTNMRIIGTVMVLVGVASFMMWLRPFLTLKRIFYSRPSDADMDVWFINDLHEFVKPRALEHLQINERSLKDENIIFIPYPVYWQTSGLGPDEVLRRADDDGLYAYSVWTVQMLVVTEKFVSYYSCIYNWPENDILEERTNEYFFEDIASVRNDIEKITKTLIGEEDEEEEKKTNISAKVFKLTNMSGDSLTLITEVPMLNVPDTYVNNLEKLVKAMRVLLRNRRYGETIQEKVQDEELGPANIETAKEMKKKGDTGATYFHQQLREIYDDYSAELEMQKAGMRIDDRNT